jgi:CheY-like chemotaxis protein
VEDNELDSSQIAKMLDLGELVSIEIASSGQQALDLIKDHVYDCITIDYMLPDIGGLDFITEVNALKKLNITPLLIYSAKDFSPKERTQLKQYANRILLKDVTSSGTAIEEAVLHLHLNHKDLPLEKRRIIENLRSKEDVWPAKRCW